MIDQFFSDPLSWATFTFRPPGRPHGRSLRFYLAQGYTRSTAREKIG